MAGRFFTAAVLFAAAFAFPAVEKDNSTANTFTYNSQEEVSNTPVNDVEGTKHLSSYHRASLTLTSNVD